MAGAAESFFGPTVRLRLKLQVGHLGKVGPLRLGILSITINNVAVM